MITKKQIEEFFSSSQIAVIGVSRNKKKFGYMVYDALKKKSINVVAVNPLADSIDGSKCYKTVEELDEKVEAAVVLTKKPQTFDVVVQLINKGIKQIWIQQESDTPEALAFAQEKGVNLIYGKCIFMFANPVTGIHKFHRSILNLFGKLPK